MKEINIAIIGLGGVGGYFGFKLAQTYVSDADIHIVFVARGDTYQVVAQNGLTLYSPEHAQSICYPHALVEEISMLENIDVFLICVKEYDLDTTCI